MGFRDIEQDLARRFVCAKCHSQGAKVRTLAMTGTGLSRLLDFQHNQYVFVSCERCGYSEIYDKRTLSSADGGGMDILDLLFGG